MWLGGMGGEKTKYSSPHLTYEKNQRETCGKGVAQKGFRRKAHPQHYSGTSGGVKRDNKGGGGDNSWGIRKRSGGVESRPTGDWQKSGGGERGGI